MSWTSDFRYALRILRKSPGFVLVATLSLGLGIALNVAIFGVINAALLRPPAVDSPKQLINLYTVKQGVDDRSPNSLTDLNDLREQNRSFVELAGASLALANVEIDRRPTLQMASIVTDGYFDMLGVRAHLGRTFLPSDHEMGANAVVLLTRSYWQRQFAGQAEIVGAILRVGGNDAEIIGVLPDGFRGLLRGLEPEFFVPISMATAVEPMGEITTDGRSGGLDFLEWRGYRFLTVTGRLRDGVQIETAEAEVQTLMANFERSYPDSNEGRGAQLIPMNRIRIDPDLDALVMPGAFLALGLVGLVLIVACANVANMLLAKAIGRRRETAVRLAIGASRWHLIRQLLVESTLLSLVGGLAGLGLAAFSLRLLELARLDLPVEITFDLGIDSRVLLFTLGLSLVTGLVFGLLPALQASRPDLVPALKDVGAAKSGSRGLRRYLQPGPLLVVAQVAVSLLLLFGAGLLQRSTSAARTVDLGFQSFNLSAVSIDLAALAGDSQEKPDQEALQQRWQRIEDEVSGIAGVESVSVASRVPLSLNVHTSDFFIPGQRETVADPAILLDVTTVDAAYFETLGLQLLEGRLFQQGDHRDSRRVAVVTQEMAKRYWPNGTALGRLFRTAAADGPETEIVGVVADYKVRTPGESPRPLVHFHRAQRQSNFGTVVFRSRQSAAPMLEAARSAIARVEPDAFVLEVTTFDRMRDTILLPLRVGGFLVSGLSMLALLLAIVGLAGLIAYWVSRSTREIGLRMALGADRRRVTRMVLKRSLSLVVVGCGFGIVGAIALGHLLRSVLFVQPLDPLSLVLGLVILLAAAAAASMVPAQRALRVDPLTALRDA